jgi:molecular chaperone GrpE
MVDQNDTPGGLEGNGQEDIEIEFVDEDSGAEKAKPAESAERGLEPVDLGPSIEVEIERIESELDELRDIHLRKLAEFDNFRKRTERERSEIRRFANEELVRELLPVLDNFERALEHGNGNDAGAFREGVEMIAKQLWDTFQRQGVEVLNPLGERFSPEFHEAVHRVEDDSKEPGTIATVLAKGYLYNGRLVRPAMVGVVAEAQPSNGSPFGQASASEGESDG